jgi:hypothetical protein
VGDQVREAALLLLGATAMHAAVIRGVVVENSSGKALARTQITLTPLPGTNHAGTETQRSTVYGNFEFAGVPAGAYIVSAARRGFPPVQYGQKSWRGAGAPVVITDDQSMFLNIRMPRYGGITGLVVDENDAGIPEHEVVAYLMAKPPRLVTQAQADERGMFRITGLMPGRYLVRSKARLYEDGGYVPTFARETIQVEDAAFVDVDLDHDSGEVRLHPREGKLHNISGEATCVVPPNSPPPHVTIVLVSDMGRESTGGVCPSVPYQFNNKPPGDYEIWAASDAPACNPPVGRCGTYFSFTIDDKDYQRDFPLLPMGTVSFGFYGPKGRVDPSSLTLQMRRVDLAGESPPDKLLIKQGVAQVFQGRWQFRLMPNPQYTATRFRGCRINENGEGGRGDGWNEVLINSRSCYATYWLSGPAAIRGTVTNAHDPVQGAPVFLEAWDEKNKKRVGELHVVRTDMYGKFELTGLAAGSYRLVSTFEFLSPESADIDEMRPRTFTIEEGRDQQQDIDLWVIK